MARSGATPAEFGGFRVRRARWGASGSCPGAFRGAFGAPKSALGALCAKVSVACSIATGVVCIAERKRFAEALVLYCYDGSCALFGKRWTHAAWVEARRVRLSQNQMNMRWLRTQSLTKHAPLCQQVRLTSAFSFQGRRMWPLARIRRPWRGVWGSSKACLLYTSPSPRDS